MLHRINTGWMIDQASCQRNNAILFHFGFETLNGRGVFFARSKTMTIGIKGRNVSWQIDVSYGTISNFIQNEAYRHISSVLKDMDGRFCNTFFFSRLISVLEDTMRSSVCQFSPTDEEIREPIGLTRLGTKSMIWKVKSPFSTSNPEYTPARKQGIKSAVILATK